MRYTIVEKLYADQECESIVGFHESITKLYAAMLTYLANVKAYCTGNNLSMSLITAVQECTDLLGTSKPVLIQALREIRSRRERGDYQAV